MNLITTRTFSLRKTAGRFFVRCRTKNALPRGRRISGRDATYLQSLNHQPKTKTDFTEFEMACVMDLGVGVFQK